MTKQMLLPLGLIRFDQLQSLKLFIVTTETTNLVNWANQQGNMIHGDKLYIVYESNTKKKYGRVVMFDLKNSAEQA